MDRQYALRIATAARKSAANLTAIDLAAEVTHRLSKAGIVWPADGFDDLTAAECGSNEQLADRILRAVAPQS